MHMNGARETDRVAVLERKIEEPQSTLNWLLDLLHKKMDDENPSHMRPFDQGSPNLNFNNNPRPSTIERVSGGMSFNNLHPGGPLEIMPPNMIPELDVYVKTLVSKALGSEKRDIGLSISRSFP